MKKLKTTQVLLWGILSWLLLIVILTFVG